MSHFIKARVASVTATMITLELSNGESLNWPITADDDRDLSTIHQGDEYILTLTHSHEVVNELLGASPQDTHVTGTQTPS